MVSNPFFFSSIFFNTKFSPKLHYAEQVRCARTIVSSNLQGLSPQRVHSKGILSPKSSHKCYFSTIHPLAMKGQTPLFHADPTSARHLQNPGGATSSLPVQRRIGQRGRCPSRYGSESGSEDAASPGTAANRAAGTLPLPVRRQNAP